MAKNGTGIVVVTCTVRGDRPLLQHRWSDAATVEKPVRAISEGHGTPREQAESVAYRMPPGGEGAALYVPGAAFARLIREAGGSHKQTGSRRSMKYVLPAAVLVLDDTCVLHDADGRELTEYEVDSRPVTIPATKGRIMRHRPRLDEWHATFTARIDTEMVEEKFIHQMVEEGGRRIGIGDYRPERGGPMGTFAVVRWAHVD